jgi:ABC-type nitrate/sulfonate/bicarbonate transport system substrate-binding protein
MSRIRTVIGSIAIGGVLLFGARVGNAAEPVTLVVGVQPSMNDIWAGVANGAFERHGVKLEFQTFTSGPAMFAALQGGAIQMGIGGMTTFYVARANGQKISWITTTGNLNQSDACMVGPNSSVKSPKDLAGKKIGFVQNSVVNGPLLEVLEANKIPKSSVQLMNLAPPAATAALLAGDLDVACLWAPFTFQIEQRGGKRLMTMNETPSGGWGVSGYAISTEWAEKHPQAVVGFLKALAEAQDAYAKNKQPAIDAVAKVTGIAPDLAKKQSEEVPYFPVKDTITPGARVSMCDAAKGKGLGVILDRATKFFVEAGTLKEKLPYDQFLAPKYAVMAFGGNCAVD